MVDLRKSLLLLVAFAVFASVAFAQPTVSTTCTTSVVPPTIRTEGITEQVGDLVMQCTGGTPTPIGTVVPRVNIVVFLNARVTSRILAHSGLGDYTEALLLVDEPTTTGNYASEGTYKGIQNPCPTDSSFQIANNYCTVIAPNDLADHGLALPSQASTYNGDSGRPNVFQGRLATSASSAPPSDLLQATAVGFFGIPFDPPGTNWTRTLRITNVKVDATNRLGSGEIPTQIQMVVSITGSQSVAILNPALTVAYVQRSLSFDTAGGSTFRQCEPPVGYCPSFEVRFHELQASAFKIKGGPTQAIPGQLTFTETGFANWDFGPQTARGNLREAGQATQGTRLIARFQNIPAGIDIYVTLQNREHGVNVTGVGQLDVDLLRIPDSNGAGSYNDYATSDHSTGDDCAISTRDWSDRGLKKLTVSTDSDGNKSAYAVWEVTHADAATLQTAVLGVTVRYQSDTLPEVGTDAGVTGHFAPLSTINTASFASGFDTDSPFYGGGIARAPYPRFVPSSDDAQSGLFTIIKCQTNLLFPFVTNYPARFDTGFAVSNTSMDPFTGNREQEGPCHIYYYGCINGDPDVALPDVDDTSVVPAGKFITWSLSAGGSNPDYGINAASGFAGYVIVRCDFQYAHGYAYISDLGAENFAQGYVALVMDASLYGANPSVPGYDPLTRTGVRSEHLDQ